MDFGKIPRTDESGQVNGEFSAMDASVGLGYAYQFEDNFTIGANVNYITSKIDNFSSAAISASAGVTYHNERTKETLLWFSEILGINFKRIMVLEKIYLSEQT
jgi:long-subunit fatty acid transport protein